MKTDYTIQARAKKLRDDVVKFNAEEPNNKDFSMTILHDEDDIVIVREEGPHFINFLTSTHWSPSGPCSVHKPRKGFRDITKPAGFSMISGGTNDSSPLQITQALMLVCKFANEDLLVLLETENP